MVFNKEFDESLQAVSDIWRNYKSRTVSTNTSPDDDMTHPEWDTEGKHYASVGEGAIRIILQSMISCEKKSANTILDMPCGFGRVTRHIKVAFPEARTYACDLYDNRISYCAEQFDVIPFKSQETLSKVIFPEKFDLIWCGSLLTHFPEPIFQDALGFFSRSLADDGIAIITLLGRVSPFIHHNIFKYLPDDAFRRVEEECSRTGFGYADYDMQAKFFEQNSYGIAVVSPSYVMKCLEDDYTVRIYGYLERHWDGQQDVLILKKTALNQK